MLRSAILFALLFVSIYSATAQTELTSLQKSRDYLNCKLSYFAINEKIAGNPSLQIKLDSVKSDLENVTIEKPLSYIELKKLLENNFPVTLIRFSEPVATLDIQAFTNLSQKEAAEALIETVLVQLKKAYPSEYDKIILQKNNLTENVTRYLSSNAPLNIEDKVILAGNIEDSSKNNNTGDVENKQATKNNFFSSSNFNFWTLLPLLLFLFLFILLANKISSLNSRISRRKKELNLLEDKLAHGNEFKQETGFSISDIDKRINSSDKMTSIEEKVRFIMEKMDVLVGSASTLSNTVKPLNEVVVTRNDNDGNVFYMSAPSNNYFSITAKSLSKENTVYKFILNPNKNEALFEIHLMGGVSVSEIAKRRESYLKPACDEENIPPGNTKNIVTKKPGLAKLEGDKWIIITKATIRYE